MLFTENKKFEGKIILKKRISQMNLSHEIIKSYKALTIKQISLTQNKSPTAIDGTQRNGKYKNQKYHIDNDGESEELWNLSERKQCSKRIKKRNDLDTLTAIAAIFLLFVLAFHLAPNQYCSPRC